MTSSPAPLTLPVPSLWIDCWWGEVSWWTYGYIDEPGEFWTWDPLEEDWIPDYMGEA